MSALNIKQLRSETLGTEHVNHLNNAGASLVTNSVHKKILEHLELERTLGGYEAAENCFGEIQNSYRAIGQLIGSQPHNIAFTENATGSFLQALSSINFSANDVILTSSNDYASNQIMYLSLVERLGVRLFRVEDDSDGSVDLHSLENLLRRLNPKLVAISHIPTSSGMVQPVKDIGRLCKQYESLYLVDACQSVGQMPIDVKEIECDFLSATGRKFLRGPRGIGFLFVSDRALDLGLKPLFPDLRGADWVLGLGTAAVYAQKLGIEEIQRRAWGLAAKTRDLLSELTGVCLLDQGAQKSAIVTIGLEGEDVAVICDSLKKLGINTSVCTKSSAVIDFDNRKIDSALRISPHYFNTEDEIEELVSALSNLLLQS